MRVVIKRTGVALARGIEVADTFWKRLRGEMFKKNPSAMLLKGRSLHVHTCFMRFPIDLLFIRGGKAVKLVHKMKPWRFCRAPRGCDGLLELPPGTLAKCKVKMGDEIVFVG